MSTTDWKERTRIQWSSDPCGSSTSRAAFGTREYFDEVEHYRYDVYAPWMRRDIGFDRHPGKRLLEVGVGMGSDHLQWARGGAVCHGIDLTPRCIDITRERLALYGLHSTLQTMDAESLQFEDESFDLVYSFGVLHHTPDTQGAIDEIYRVLKPGGSAIIMLYHRDSWHVMMRCVLMWGLHQRGFDAKTLHDMLGEGEYAATRTVLPLVKTYSRGEAQFLFRKFRRADNIVRQLTREEVWAASGPAHEAVPKQDSTAAPGFEVKVDPWRVIFDAVRAVGKDLSDGALEELGALFGWNVVVFAEK